jgi:phage shock protein A
MESALQDFIAARATAASPSGASPSGAGASGSTSGSIGGTILGMAERAGSAFDRVLARETGIAGVTSPINADASKLRELQEMARAHRIDERLAALKATIPDKR